MVIKGYSTFRKVSALLEPHHQIVTCHIQTLVRGADVVLPLGSRLGKICRKVRMAVLWLNNYRQRIKSTDLNNLIWIKQNFCRKDHNFNRDTKFIIIERIEKNINNLKKEEEWEKVWNFHVAFGFNIKQKLDNHKQIYKQINQTISCCWCEIPSLENKTKKTKQKKNKNKNKIKKISVKKFT